VDVEDHHLCRAPGLAARLDHAGEGVEALHEADRAGGRSAAARPSVLLRSVLRLLPVPDPYLKSIPSVWPRVRIESMVSCTELMKQAEHCGWASIPTLNQTGLLKAARCLSRMSVSSAWKAAWSSAVAKEWSFSPQRPMVCTTRH